MKQKNSLICQQKRKRLMERREYLKKCSEIKLGKFKTYLKKNGYEYINIADDRKYYCFRKENNYQILVPIAKEVLAYSEMILKGCETLSNTKNKSIDLILTEIEATLTKEEIAKWLYENCYDKNKNEIDLRDLDFTPFNCNVDLSFMEVEGELVQSFQAAKIIRQHHSEAEIIYQGENKADIIWQGGQEAKLIYQNSHFAKEVIQDDLNGEEDDD